MHDLSRRFTDALTTLDREGDTEPILALFAPDAELTKLDAHHVAQGRDGARQFWEDYREVFGDVRTTFTHTTQGKGSVALEWVSTGTLRNGKELRYSGVSVLEGDGEQVRKFRPYYDSAVFLAEAPPQ